MLLQFVWQRLNRSFILSTSEGYRALTRYWAFPLLKPFDAAREEEVCVCQCVCVCVCVFVRKYACVFVYGMCKLCANEIITSVSFTIGSNTSPPFAHTTALAHGVEDVSERGTVHKCAGTRAAMAEGQCGGVWGCWA